MSDASHGVASKLYLENDVIQSPFFLLTYSYLFCIYIDGKGMLLGVDVYTGRNIGPSWMWAATVQVRDPNASLLRPTLFCGPPPVSFFQHTFPFTLTLHANTPPRFPWVDRLYFGRNWSPLYVLITYFLSPVRFWYSPLFSTFFFGGGFRSFAMQLLAASGSRVYTY